jgi:hypothetical protein
LRRAIPVGRGVQPGRSANAQPLRGGIDAGQHLRIEAQADRGDARVVVLQRGSGPHESCWRDALGCSRRCVVIIQFRSPALDEGDDLLHQFGHVAREAPE